MLLGLKIVNNPHVIGSFGLKLESWKPVDNSKIKEYMFIIS